METLNKARKIDYKSFLWNIIGSMIGAASSFVLLLCVVRTVGEIEGGIFSLAFSTSQILLTFGKFGVRSFQATDIKSEITFGVYLQTRIWFCLGMLLLGIAYVLFAGYNFRKSSIFILICILKIADAIEDVFHGQLQNIGYLDVAGKLLTLRNLLTMLVFGVCMLSLKDLFYASIISASLTIIITIFLNVKVTRRYIPISLSFSKDQTFYLLKSCMPLFLGSFLSLYIYNAPKYAIDFIGSEAQITYYSIIFMPAFVINLFSEFAFKPLLTVIASIWEEQDFIAFFKMVRKLLLNIMVITFITMAGAYLIGVQFLSWFYSVDVTSYRTELMLLMLSGGFSAGVYLLYNVLTSMRLQKIIITNYFIASIMVTVLGYLLVCHIQITGAATAYFITEIILFSLMLLATYNGYQKGLQDNESRNHNFSGNK